MTRLLPVLLIVAACTTAPLSDPVEILVSRQGESCTALIEGRSYPLLVDSPALLTHFADLKAHHRRAVLIAPADSPYRCIGGIIYAAQRTRLDLAFSLQAAAGPTR